VSPPLVFEQLVSVVNVAPASRSENPSSLFTPNVYVPAVAMWIVPRTRSATLSSSPAVFPPNVTFGVKCPPAAFCGSTKLTDVAA
jgi:hypothetical protein